MRNIKILFTFINLDSNDIPFSNDSGLLLCCYIQFFVECRHLPITNFFKRCSHIHEWDRVFNTYTKIKAKKTINERKASKSNKSVQSVVI